MLKDLEQVCRDLAVMFAEDPSAPSVTVSKLPNGQWYAACHRYTQRMGQGKVVVCKVVERHLLTAVEKLKDELAGTPEYRAAVEVLKG